MIRSIFFLSNCFLLLFYPFWGVSKTITPDFVSKTSHTQSLDKEISGIVTDASTGQVLIGVTILVQGSAIGATTDEQGSFRLSIPDTSELLLISYLGYSSVTVEIGDKLRFEIQLQEEITALKEVVIVGYGTQETYKVSAAIQQINQEDLEIDKRPVSTIESSLVGSLPGLILDQNSGQLGSGIGIQIRAASALENKQALVLVDGFESSIQNLNPADIASVSILKDAAAAAIYGARGANGVVLSQLKGPKKMNLFLFHSGLIILFSFQ